MILKTDFLKILSLVAALVATACNQEFKSASLSSNTGPTINAVNGLESFKSGFYELGKTRGCASCHGVRDPLFGAADINTAYKASLKLIDFNKPATSILVDYFGNAHCGTPSCSDPSARPSAVSALESWAKAELAAKQPNNPNPTTPPPVTKTYKYQTSTLQVPAVIPSLLVTAPAIMRFPLSQLKPPVAVLANAILELEVHLTDENPMSVENNYRFLNPKIVGSTLPVQIIDLSLFIKENNTDPNQVGTENTTLSSNWHSVVFDVPVTALPNPIPTTRFNAPRITTIPMFFPTKTKTDFITIGIGDIK